MLSSEIFTQEAKSYKQNQLFAVIRAQLFKANDVVS